MTDNLALAVRRAKLAKDAPRQHPKWTPAPQPPPPPAPKIASWLPSRAQLLEVLSKRRPIEVIQHAVAAAYGIEVAGLLSARRSLNLVRPRQVAMYVCAQVLHASNPQIGRRFNRDHSTVFHAIRHVEQMRRTDLEFEFKLQKLMDDLKEVLR
jgi:hypothetical protein